MTEQQQPRPVRRRRLGGPDFSMDDATAPTAADQPAASPPPPAAPAPAVPHADEPAAPPGGEPEQPPPPRPDAAGASASRNASKRASKGAPVHPGEQAPAQADTQAAAGRGAVTWTQLMRGRANPYHDVGQSGVRLPLFLRDAVRTYVAVSRGQWTVQRLVSEAVEHFLAELGQDEIVEEAWQEHGGPAGLRDEHRPR